MWGRRLTSLEVHVGTPTEKCQEINTRLLEDTGKDGGYSKDLFDNLVYRYEEPNGMTRWDSPLFTVPFDDKTPSFEAIWDAMIGSDGKAKVTKPNLTTVAVNTECGYVGEHGVLMSTVRRLRLSQTTFTSWTEHLKKWSILFWTGRRTILVKAAGSYPYQKVPSSYLQIQSHYRNCKESGGSSYQSTASGRYRRAEFGIHLLNI